MKLSLFLCSLTLGACHHEASADRASPEPPAAALASSPTSAPQLEDHAGAAVATAHDADVDAAPEVAATSQAPIMDSEPSSSEARAKKPPKATSKDWSRAVVLPLARNNNRCEARRWGDWVRVGCTGVFANIIEQLAGDPVGVSFGKEKTDKPYIDRQYVVFPLRKGDRRVIQLGSIEGGWRFPWTVSAGAVISAAWLDDAPAPEVVID